MIGVSVTVNNFVCISFISDNELEDKYVINRIDYTDFSIGKQRVLSDLTKNVIGSELYGKDISGNIFIMADDYEKIYKSLLQKYKFAYR